jgi:hypothetical protein
LRWRIGTRRSCVHSRGTGFPGSQSARLGIGISLASFRRFWAVAARRNSSRAPFGPLSLSRSSLRMRWPLRLQFLMTVRNSHRPHRTGNAILFPLPLGRRERQKLISDRGRRCGGPAIPLMGLRKAEVDEHSVAHAFGQKATKTLHCLGSALLVFATTSRRPSGSMRAENAVEPTRSENITVNWRRSAVS